MDIDGSRCLPYDSNCKSCGETWLRLKLFAGTEAVLEYDIDIISIAQVVARQAVDAASRRKDLLMGTDALSCGLLLALIVRVVLFL